MLRPIVKSVKHFTKVNVNQIVRWRATLASVNYEQTVLNIPPTRLTILDNGVRVATEDTGCPTAAVGLFVDVGSRYENEANNGVSYFIEHLAFKGSKKRSQKELESEIGKMGAHVGAHTGRENCSYVAKCMAKDVPKMVELISDSIFNNKFGEAELECARKEILKELGNTDLKTVVDDYLHSVAFQGTPYAKSIMGPSKNVKSITGDDIRNFISFQYKAPTLVLAGAGGVEHEALVQLANDHLGQLTNEYAGNVPKDIPIRYTGSGVLDRDDALPLCHAILAAEGLPWNHPDRLALEVAALIVGEYDHTHGGTYDSPSTMANQCHEAPLASSFQMFSKSYASTGLWGCYFTGGRMHLEDFIMNLQHEWMRICNNPTDFEVDRAKNALRARYLSGLNCNMDICNDIGLQVLNHGRRHSLNELEQQLEAINGAVVREAMFEHIYNRCPVVAAVGPTEQIHYDRLRMYMYWVRV